jgi:hypothetical protein
MRKIIQRKLCDTETARHLGTKYEGEYGDPAGYEEKLYITKTKQYFLYGVGGVESKYAKEKMLLLTGEQAGEWLKENGKK